MTSPDPRPAAPKLIHAVGRVTFPMVLALAAGACGGEEGSPAAAEVWTPPAGVVADPALVPACVESPVPLPEPEEVASGLAVPWDLAFLPDGRILVVERGGTVRQIVDGELREAPWATLPVEAVAEAGLLGIAVDPDFEKNGHVYLAATFVDSSLPARLGRVVSRLLGAEGESAWQNRVVRLTDRDGRGTEPTVIADGLVAGPIHAGGGLRFGPDGRLYLGVGDGGVPDRAVDPSSAGGKIHVLVPSMDTPPEVFASGFRNPQRIAFHPGTGALLAAEHGPSGIPGDGFRTGRDELDLVVEGGDYGWPAFAGRWRGGEGMAPLAEWSPAIAPGDLAFVDDTTSAWHGDLVVSSLLQRRLLRLAIDDSSAGTDSLSIVCETNLYQGRFGRLRAVHAGPDGQIYFTTSNRDQRGVPGEGDDRLMRFSPPAAEAGAAR